MKPFSIDNDYRLPPLKAVRAFEATARHLSFSRAANELHVTQSAVSHQVKVLEEFLGQQLLLRQNKRVSLTQEGDAFYSVIGDCFQRMVAATNNLIHREKVSIKVVAQTSMAVDWLSPRLANFTTLFPSVDVMLHMESSAANFNAEDFDIIVATWPKPDGFRSRQVREEKWFPVCSPTLYKKLTIKTPTSLLKFPLYSSEHGEDWNLWMQHHDVLKDVETQMQFFGLALLAVRAAIAGKGITLSNQFMTHDLIEQGLLKKVPSLSYTLPWGHYHIHYRNDSYFKEPIKHFVDWFIDICR